MKKIIAALLALTLVFGLSVTAFAADSPMGDELFTVTFIDGKTGMPQTKTLKPGETTTYTADPSKGVFDGFSIYKADGTPAVAGVDYEIVSSTTHPDGALVLSARDTTIVIRPLTSLIVTANYNNEVTNPKPGNGESTSPVTGDFSDLALAAALAALLGAAFFSKKKLAK